MKKLIWIGLAFLVVLVGCDLTSRDFYRAEDDFPENGKGMLLLVFDSSAIAKVPTIDPTDADAAILNVDNYVITGTHTITPSTDFFTSPITQAELDALNNLPGLGSA